MAEGNIVKELERMAEEVEYSYDTQIALNSILRLTLVDISLEELLKRALEFVLSIKWLSLESKGCIFLVESAPDILVMKAQNNLSGTILQSCASVPFGRCLCGMAAQKKEIQFAERMDERHEITYGGISPHGHYCVPIMQSDKVLGVLNLYVKEGQGRNKREDDFLRAVADTLAGAIMRNRIEGALEKLNKCFLDFGSDSAQNIEKLTRVTGEILNATCALYNRREGALLVTLAGWQTPPDLPHSDNAEGHICSDIISEGGKDATIIRDLSSTRYAKTDPNVSKYNLKTYLGYPIKLQGKPIASLCAVFQSDFKPDPYQLKLFQTLAAAAAVEEERRRAEDELKIKVKELEEFQELSVGRELVMIKLKNDNNELLEKLGIKKAESDEPEKSGSGEENV